MTTPPPHEHRRSPDQPGDAKRRLLRPADRRSLLIFAILSIGLSVMPLIGSVTKPYSNKDYSTWLMVGEKVLAGEPLFPPDIQHFSPAFYYPPAIGVLVYAPLSLLGPTGMVLLLCALAAASHAFAVLLSVWFATGRVRDQHPLLYLIPTALTVPFVWDIYFLGQHNLILLAIMLLGFLALERGRNVRAGLWLMLPAAAKAFPATVIGYLLWCRKWIASLAMVFSLAVVLFILPGPFHGFARTFQEMGTWADRVLVDSASGDSIASMPHRAWRYGNQSLMSVVHRYTRDLQAGARDEDLTVNIVDIGSTGAFIVFAVVAGAMLGAYLWALPGCTTGRGRRTRRTAGMAYAGFLLMMVMFSPKAGTYYYCWMIPALAMVTGEMLRAPAGSPRRRWLAGGLGAMTAIMATGLLQPVNKLPQAMGSTCFGAVILFIMLVWLMAKARPEDERPGDLAQRPDPAPTPAN